jgi:hypothetical protein
VDVLATDRHRLRFVFRDFHAHAVRRDDEGLVQPVVVAREHCHARGATVNDKTTTMLVFTETSLLSAFSWCRVA